jgi:uncharacterized phage protein (TIGR02218 family)
MKQVTVQLQAHIASEVTSLSVCWLVIRPDGTTLGFTEHDEDVEITDWVSPNDVLNATYKASSAYSRTAIQTSSDLSIDNLEADGILDSDAITDDDLSAGLYDNSAIYVFMVNWADLSQGPIKLRKGNLGEVKILDYYYTSELRGLAQKLTRHIIEQYSSECRAILGDTRCKVDIDALKQSGTVSSTTDSRHFSGTGLTAVANYWAPGYLVWTLGQNTGLKMDVKVSGAGTASPSVATTFEIFLGMPFDIAIGDQFDIFPGCDGKLSTCKTKFNNVVNFRGEPYTPTTDQVISYPDNKDFVSQ